MATEPMLRTKPNPVFTKYTEQLPPRCVLWERALFLGICADGKPARQDRRK